MWQTGSQFITSSRSTKLLSGCRFQIITGVLWVNKFYDQCHTITFDSNYCSWIQSFVLLKTFFICLYNFVRVFTFTVITPAEWVAEGGTNQLSASVISLAHYPPHHSDPLLFIHSLLTVLILLFLFVLNFWSMILLSFCIITHAI